MQSNCLHEIQDDFKCIEEESKMSLYIVNKIPKKFNEIQVNDKTIIIKEAEAEISADTIHVCLYCETLKNITLIVCTEEIYKVSFVMDTKEQFEATLRLLKNTYKNVEFSEQNKKINGYATALVEKLQDGIELTIVDSTDTVKVPICPECGMQCDPSIPYCMECGASI